MNKYLAIVFIILLSIGAVKAQELNALKTFAVDNPLSYQLVRDIAQDKDDFVWFGTQEGLHRYDGYKFLSFHHEANNKRSLSSSNISTLYVDSKANLWVGTGAGLNLYHEDTQDFEHFTSQSGELSITDDSINDIIEDDRGSIWVGTENGLNILFWQGNGWKVKRITKQPGNPKTLTHNRVQALVQTSNNTIWVGTNGGGISVFDLEGNFIESIDLKNKEGALAPTMLIEALHQDKAGNIWIGTIGEGILRYDHLSGDFSNFTFDKNDEKSVSSNTIEDIFEDSSSRIWVATDKGLSIYDKVLDKFDRYNHSATDPNSLANDLVKTFFEDSRNMIWIGTFSGVNLWNPNVTTFAQYNPLRHPQMSNAHVTSFSQAKDGPLYFSTYSGGIYQLKSSDKQIIKLELGDAVKDLSVMKLYAEGQSLWIGTRSSGLYQIDLTTNKVNVYKNDPKNPQSISANSITDILKDRHGNIWISTFHQGLNRLNKNGTFTHFTQTTPVSDKGPSTNHLLQIIENEQGLLWLATFGGGINRFDPTSKTFKHLKHDDKDPTSISSDVAWTMLLDDKSNLWVGTQTDALNLLSAKEQQNGHFKFSHLGMKDGLKSRTIHAINQDNGGNIWFSSSQGISRYSPTNHSIKNFDTTHGLLDMEYNHGVSYRDSDKTLYFGSPKGFNSVDPSNILNAQEAPIVRMTDILKFNEPMVFDRALSKLNELTFKHSDQVISFEYVGLNYADPASTRYKYRLKGFDRDWVDAGKLKRATYTNLPSGRYDFQVIAANNDNVWSDPGLTLTVVVQPAPWNTWWAYLLYAIFTALSLLLYSRFVNRKLQLEQQQKVLLEQQVEEKTRDFQQKNIELEHANKQLENAATTDKLTGVKSRRYLDIYIEQASRLMSQIHQNILPVQRSVLPRLYLFMVKVSDVSQVSNSQLINLTDLLLYSRNNDDLVIRWSDDTFAVIGYEKEKNARELASRLSNRFSHVFDQSTRIDMAYSFYPFNFEQPMALTWDQVSVLTELALKQVGNNDDLCWLGLHAPKVQPFDYLEALKVTDLASLNKLITTKQG